MTAYDFTTILDRRGRDALAIDGLNGSLGFAPKPPADGFDLIPMWIADMNFETVPTVQQAMINRAEHGAFGYFLPTELYYNSIIKWHENMKGVSDIGPDNISYHNGVLGGVVSALNAFSAPGDPILVNGPTYVGFLECLRDNGRRIVTSELIKDHEGIMRLDLEDMERKLVEERIHLAIFCSPHNPCGRVWEEGEVKAIMELFKKHQVIVISDEIWSDLILDGHRHIPLQSVSEDAKSRTIAFYAPSKTFNLAGLVGSYSIIYDKMLKDRMDMQSSKSHYNEMNVMSMHALTGAYCEEGREWLRQLLEVIEENVDYSCRYIEENFDGVDFSRPQGTYMLYIDCSRWCERENIPIKEIIERGWKVGVAWEDGAEFGGVNTIRLNLALPASRVAEAFDRMKKYVFVR